MKIKLNLPTTKWTEDVSMANYKCNNQRDISFNPQVYKECGKYYIHGKGNWQGVVVLSKFQAEKIYKELGKLLGKKKIVANKHNVV